MGLVAGALLAALVPASTASAETDAPVPVQLLSFPDLHGYFGDYTTTVRPTAGAPVQRVGGGAYLATHIKQLRAGQENSILFSAGDDFSGWPDETEWFWNEPTIEYLNMLGLDFSTVGNHEMDRGTTFLRHMIDGTCEGRPDDDLCFEDSTGQRFQGADYEYYSANMVDEASGEPVRPPYHVEYVDDGNGGTLPVGFVNATTVTAATGMSYYPGGGVEYLPVAAAVNKYAAILEAQGVHAIVAVMHEGFTQKSGSGYNDCVDPRGPVTEFNRTIDPSVDAIVTGHWHAQVNCMLPDPAGALRPVVEAGNHGKLINEINLQLDPVTGDVLRDRTTSVNHANTQDVPPDAETVRMTQYWKSELAERAATPVATVTADLTRSPNEYGESSLYNVTADAFLWAANQDGEADLAVVMPGIVRRDVTYDANPANPADAPGRVLFPEVAVGTIVDSGIGWGLLRGTLTGKEIDALLESQWRQAADGSVTYRHMAVSGNVAYTYDLRKPVGQRVTPGHVRIDGRPLTPNTSYRIATVGNGPAALFDARDQDRSLYNGGDALWRYMEAHSPVDPPSLDRAQPRKQG